MNLKPNELTQLCNPTASKKMMIKDPEMFARGGVRTRDSRSQGQNFKVSGLLRGEAPCDQDPKEPWNICPDDFSTPPLPRKSAEGYLS